MSSRLVGQVLEHYPREASLGEFALAIIMADEAAHSGGNIRAAIPEMARLSRQSEQHVRRIMKKMQVDGWLQCVERSEGGRKRTSLYRINPDWVALPLGWKPEHGERVSANKPEHNPNMMFGFNGAKPEPDVRVSGVAPSLFKSFPPLPPQNSEIDSGVAAPSATAEDEVLRLARWMLGQLRTLHPQHGEPNWKRWCREIRGTLRDGEQSGRTVRDVAELFKWANEQRVPKPGSDFCWANNILSPAALRKHWDRLAIERNAAKPTAAQTAVADPLCSKCRARPWSRQQGRTGPRLCGVCADALDQAA